MNLELEGRVGWIIGAAGGIGQAISLALAREGVQTVISSRDEANLRRLAAEMKQVSGLAPLLLPMDITDRTSVDAATQSAVTASGRIDFLVNSTSAPIVGAFEELTDEAWEEVIQTKYLGYMRMLRAVLPQMQRQRFGRIVNISGGGGKRPSALHLPGGGANSAVNHLSKGLADIYGQYNIRINTVSPGPINSERLSMIAKAAAETPAAGATPESITSSPLGRSGVPEEVADAVLYLLSNRSAYITGVLLPVDGGRSPLA